MPKTYKAYAVVRDNNPEQFAQKVQQYLTTGWLCRGKMITARSHSGLYDYVQNMVLPIAPSWAWTPVTATSQKGTLPHE